MDTAFIGLTSCRRITIAKTLADWRRGAQPTSCRLPCRCRRAADRYTLTCDGPGSHRHLPKSHGRASGNAFFHASVAAAGGATWEECAGDDGAQHVLGAVSQVVGGARANAITYFLIGK